MGASRHSVSGNPAIVRSPAVTKIENLKVHFSPIQEGSGTPSPSNIRPFVPWTAINACQSGTNVLPFCDVFTEGWTNTADGLTATYSHGIVHVEGTHDKEGWTNVVDFPNAWSNDPIILPPGTYITSRPTDTSSAHMAVRVKIDGDASAVNKAVAFTVNESAQVLGFYIAFKDEASYNTDVPLVLTPGTVRSTEYKPYTPIKTIPVTLTATGKNLIHTKYPSRESSGITFTVNADWSITTSGTATAQTWLAPNLTTQPQYLTHLSPGTYFLSGGISRDEYVYLGGVDENGTVLSFPTDSGYGIMYTIDRDVWVYPQVCVTNGTSSNRTFHIQLERGSSATEYESYSEISEFYGGYLDLADGKVVAEWKKKTFTDPTQWVVTDQGNFACHEEVSDKKLTETSYNFLCSAFNPVWESTAGNPYIRFTYAASRQIAIIKNGSELTLDDVKAVVSSGDMSICYPLATPITYYLPAEELETLRGVSNYWSSANDTVDATYEVVESAAMTKAKKRIVANTPHLEQLEPYDFGDILRFNTNMKAPLKTCGVVFAPTQEGTGNPSPTNVRALIGRKSIEIKQTGKNLCPVIGFSGTGGADTESLRSSHYALTNSYGTTLSNVAGQSVTITQTNYSESQVASYKNGYFGVVFHGLEFGRYYKVSFRVSNIVNNPLNVSLEDIVIANPYGSWFTNPEVIGDRVVFTYLHMANSVRPTQMPIDIRNCGMSCTFSDFMVTSVDEEDQTYVPYEQLPGKNLFYCCAIDKEQAGVSYHRNYDGTVSVSGTPTGYSMIELGQAFVDSSAGSIRISGCLDTTNMCWDSINLYDSTKTLIATLDSISGNPYNYVVDISQYTNLSYITLSAKRKNNDTVTSGMIKPQIEIASGTTNTTFEPYNDGTYHIDMPYIGRNLFPCREEDMVSDGWNRYFPNPFPEAGTYTVSCVAAFGGTGDKGCALAFKDTPSNEAAEIGSHYFGYTFGSSTATTSRQKTITITQEQADAAYIVFLMMSGGSTYETFKYANIQIEHGSTKTFYTPYNDNMIYGAAVDVARGTVYVTHMYAELAAVNRYDNANYFFTTAGEQALGNIASTNAGLMCNRLTPVLNTTERDTEPYISFYHNNIIRWVDPDYLSITSANEYNDATASDRVKIVYELAEPIVVQIDPVQIKTLLGYNAIRAGADEAVGVAYWTH